MKWNKNCMIVSCCIAAHNIYIEFKCVDSLISFCKSAWYCIVIPNKLHIRWSQNFTDLSSLSIFLIRCGCVWSQQCIDNTPPHIASMRWRHPRNVLDSKRSFVWMRSGGREACLKATIPSYTIICIKIWMVMKLSLSPRPHAMVYKTLVRVRVCWHS